MAELKMTLKNHTWRESGDKQKYTYCFTPFIPFHSIPLHVTYPPHCVCICRGCPYSGERVAYCFICPTKCSTQLYSVSSNSPNNSDHFVSLKNVEECQRQILKWPIQARKSAETGDTGARTGGIVLRYFISKSIVNWNTAGSTRDVRWSRLRKRRSRPFVPFILSHKQGSIIMLMPN